MSTEKGIDVFVSYAREDRDWVEAFVGELKTAWGKVEGGELDVYTDHQLRTGDLWREKLLSAVESCRIFVPVLSKNYTASYETDGGCRMEWDLAVARADQRDLIFPVAMESGIEKTIFAERQFRRIHEARGSRDWKHNIQYLAQDFRPYLLKARLPLQVYGIANMKGGVGKTTLAIAIAEFLGAPEKNTRGRIVRPGRPVLVVDADYQANATELLVGSHDGLYAKSALKAKTLYDLLLAVFRDEEEVDLGRYVHRDPAKAITESRNQIHIIPGSHRFRHWEGHVAQEFTGDAGRAAYQRGKDRLARAVKQYARDHKIRHVIIDTPPYYPRSMNAILGLCDKFIVPMTPDRAALTSTRNFLDLLRRNSGFKDEVCAIVVNRWFGVRQYSQREAAREAESLANQCGSRFIRIHDDLSMSKVLQDPSKTPNTLTEKYRTLTAAKSSSAKKGQSVAASDARKALQELANMMKGLGPGEKLVAPARPNAPKRAKRKVRS